MPPPGAVFFKKKKKTSGGSVCSNSSKIATLHSKISFGFCTPNYHPNEKTDRNVKIFYVFGKIHFESIRFWYCFEKLRKSIFNGFFGGGDFPGWRELGGQRRSSQPEVDFGDFRDSGGPGAGPEEIFGIF